MPKPPSRNNPPKVRNAPRSRAGRAAIRPGKPSSIKDLLAKSGLGDGAMAAGTEARQRWRDALLGHLPAELGPQLGTVSESEGRLAVSAKSAAWSARLRYALAECWPALRAEHPQLKDYVVRIQPAAASTGART